MDLESRFIADEIKRDIKSRGKDFRVSTKTTAIQWWHLKVTNKNLLFNFRLFVGKGKACSVPHGNFGKVGCAFGDLQNIVWIRDFHDPACFDLLEEAITACQSRSSMEEFLILNPNPWTTKSIHFSRETFLNQLSTRSDIEQQTIR